MGGGTRLEGSKKSSSGGCTYESNNRNNRIAEKPHNWITTNSGSWQDVQAYPGEGGSDGDALCEHSPPDIWGLEEIL